MRNFAEELCAVRKERNLTQEQLSQEIKVSRATISRQEKGLGNSVRIVGPENVREGMKKALADIAARYEN